MEPCYLCSDSFNKSLFQLSCGCQFHVYCIRFYFIFRTVPTCPKCQAVVTCADKLRLKQQFMIKRSEMSKPSAFAAPEPNTRQCELCRRALQSPKLVYSLHFCEHTFHVSCLKTNTDRKCFICGIEYAPEDYTFLGMEWEDDCLIVEDERWKDCIIVE